MGRDSTHSKRTLSQRCHHSPKAPHLKGTGLGRGEAWMKDASDALLQGCLLCWGDPLLLPGRGPELLKGPHKGLWGSKGWWR